LFAGGKREQQGCPGASWRAAIAGEAIFHDDDDRRFFLLTLDRAWVLMGGLLSWWKQACDGGATAEMLRCGSASAAHSSGTTVQPASYDLSNFFRVRSTVAADGGVTGVVGGEVEDAFGGERQSADASTGQEARTEQDVGSAETFLGGSGWRCP
jgi:hypothetical protein